MQGLHRALLADQLNTTGQPLQCFGTLGVQRLSKRIFIHREASAYRQLFPGVEAPDRQDGLHHRSLALAHRLDTHLHPPAF